MTFGRYLTGLVLAGVALGPVVAAASAWRARLLPGWSGAPARLAEMIMSLSAVVVVTELVGTVHLFRLWAVVPALTGAGMVAWYAARRQPMPTQSAEGLGGPAPNPPPSGATVAAVAAVGVLVADWGTRTAAAFHYGMTTVDTLWYHLPFAAGYVQQGTITPLHYVDSDPVTVFFPATSELLHALGILVMGNDVLSPLINLGWLGVALLAGWCVGRPFGVAPVTLTGVAVLLATPGLVATQPGGGYNDVVGLALVLSCAALLVTTEAIAGTTRVAGLAVAGLAAGLALGTKFTFVAPVGALTIGVWVLARRGRRLREVSGWLVPMAVTGAFWYVRNLWVVGNPIPSLHIKVGPLSLPSPKVTTPSSTVAHFLFDGSSWRKYFLPGLRESFGPAWWVLLALAAAGLVLWVRTGNNHRTPRMLAWVGVATAAAFVVTPQYLAILGAPVFFVDNVRYADAAVVMGLVLLPVAPMVRTGKRPWWVLAAFGAVLAVTQLDGTLWPSRLLSQRFAAPVTGIDSALGAAAGLVGVGLALFAWRRRGDARRPPVAAVALVVVALLASGFGLQQTYLRHRYTHPDPSTVLPWAIYAWAQGVSGARIAVAGSFTQLQYPLYGRQQTNVVEYVGQPGPHGGYAPIATCDLWRRTLNAGHFRYVLTSTGPVATPGQLSSHPSAQTEWTATDPASRLIAREMLAIPPSEVIAGDVGFTLFQLNGPLDPRACAPSGPPTSAASRS